MADQNSETTIDGAGRGGGTNSTGPAEAADAAKAADGGAGEDHEARVDRLGGGGEGARAAGVGTTGAGSATGDASAMRSETGSGDGLGGPDAGSPGGMDGVRAQGGTGTDRPPGGVSPVQEEEEEGR
ncbi:MAG: hypothetical protein ACK40O_02820 [Allosphingosinicella sp.]